MTAYKELGERVAKTEAMSQLIKGLEEEPARILSLICREYKETSQPVPDYHLGLFSFVAEVSMRALIAAGLIKSQSGSRLSLYSYKPTDAGLEIYDRLTADGFVKGQR